MVDLNVWLKLGLIFFGLSALAGIVAVVWSVARRRLPYFWSFMVAALLLVSVLVAIARPTTVTKVSTGEDYDYVW